MLSNCITINIVTCHKTSVTTMRGAKGVNDLFGLVVKLRSFRYPLLKPLSHYHRSLVTSYYIDCYAVAKHLQKVGDLVTKTFSHETTTH